MAIFELEIGNEDVQRVLDAVSGNYHRPESVENPDYVAALEANPEELPPLDENGDPIPSTIENPETKGNFTHRMVREFLGGHVQAWEIKQAKIAAAEALDTTVELSDPNP